MKVRTCKHLNCPALTRMEQMNFDGCIQLDKPDIVGQWVEPVEGVSKEQCRRVREAISKKKEVQI